MRIDMEYLRLFDVVIIVEEDDEGMLIENTEDDG